MELFLYFAKVSACTIIFYFFYHFVLARFTFFNFNRWYLIGTLLLSFIIPILSITIEKEVAIPSQSLTETSNNIAVSKIASNAIDPEFAETSASLVNSISLADVLWLVYFSVFAFFLIRLLIGIIRILWKARNCSSNEHLNLILVEHDCKFKNSSFHKYIFIDKNLSDEIKNQVIHHEEIHVSSYHFIDKLIVGLSTCVLWFSPFVYAYLHAIEANHEFEVDAKSIRTFDKKTYASLILNLAQPSQHLFINHFSKLPLKKRMNMLFQNPTNRMKKLVYLSILPLLAICCLAFVKQKEVMIYVKSSGNITSNLKTNSAQNSIEKNIINNNLTLTKAVQSSDVETNDSSKQEDIYERQITSYIETQQRSRIDTKDFITQQPIIKKERILVVDAGHGGADNASKSVIGTFEKDMTLRAAFILKEEAEKRGIKVIMTREKDEFIKLYDRRDKGGEGDAFISLHFQTMPKRKNGKPYENGFKGLEVMVSNKARGGEKLKESTIFGNQVLASLKTIDGISVRDSLREMSLAVLSDAKVPSILMELGNISYQDSFDFVNDEENLRKICNLILDGFEKSGC